MPISPHCSLNPDRVAFGDLVLVYRCYPIERPVVTATTGALQVADNGQQVLIAEGKAMSFPDGDQQGNDQGNNKNKGSAVPVAGGTNVTGPILLGAGTAAALFLLVYLTTRSCHPVSPTGSC